MKKILLILTVFSTLISNAQRNIDIIYVEVSDKNAESSLLIIQNQIKSILKDSKSNNNDIFFYISQNVVDGDDFSTRSFMTTDANEGIRKMETGYLQGAPTGNSPDYFLDTKDINTYLLTNNCLQNINSEEFELTNYLTFYFFLYEESYNESVRNGKCIVNLIANANRLVDNGDIIERCAIYKKLATLEGGKLKSGRVKNLYDEYLKVLEL